jgi:hypothetical protein
MRSFADLLRGIAALLWPIFAIGILIVFRKELSALLYRLRKAKILGVEAELGERLDELQETAQSLPQGVEPVSPPASEPTTTGETEDVSRLVLEEASRSPKVALMLLSAELERSVRQLIGSLGDEKPPGRRGRFVSLRSGLEELVKRTNLPVATLGALNQFSEVRNSIIHGKSDISDDEILRAVDSGLVILKSVEAVPRETHIVHFPNAEVFSDPEARRLRTDCHAVILDTYSPGGAVRSLRVFPTTCTHFVKGMRVAWDWNSARVWGESWYKDPDDNEVKYAWTESAEFVGRNLEQV